MGHRTTFRVATGPAKLGFPMAVLMPAGTIAAEGADLIRPHVLGCIWGLYLGAVSGGCIWGL